MRIVREALAIALAAVAAIVMAAPGAGAAAKFKVGMAVGGNTCCEWMKRQGEVARSLAAARGWD
jgi:hypothetical protein